jgi:hypothetical protein
MLSSFTLTLCPFPILAALWYFAHEHDRYRYAEWRFCGVAAFAQAGVTLTGFRKPTQENAFVVSPSISKCWGPARRKVIYAAQDLNSAGYPEAVLSHTLAQRLFGIEAGDRQHGRFQLSGLTGAAPPEFRGTFTVGPVDAVWLGR